MLDPGLLHEIIEGCVALWNPSGDPELEAIRVAILIEDALDLRVPEGVLDAEHLGDEASLTRTIDGLVRS